MSIVRTMMVYGFVAAAGWGAHEAYDAMRDANAEYLLSELRGKTIVERTSDGVKLPADMLFESYRLSQFMKRQLDGLDDQYREFLLPQQQPSPANKGSIDGLIRGLE